MKNKTLGIVAFLGITGLCIGLSGCGKNVDTVAESTVPIEIGEHVMYGSYQGEPVEWRVLDKKDGEILLLSEYGLDILPFDDSGSGSIIWENSSIRNWLNNEFYNSTFSKEEQEIFWYPLRKDLTKIMNQYPGKVRNLTGIWNGRQRTKFFC